MARIDIDLHTHTLFSDGVLLPAELARRMEVAGFKAMAFTDHIDSSRTHIIEPIVKVCIDLNKHLGIKVVPGAELTHIPPGMVAELAREVRGMGAQIIVFHGETIAEPVAEGANMAALNSDIDILAHPGMLTKEEAELAAERGIALEITIRKGHSLCNGHVAALALEAGAPMLINSDAHTPDDIKTPEWRDMVGLGAGLKIETLGEIRKFAESLIE